MRRVTRSLLPDHSFMVLTCHEPPDARYDLPTPRRDASADDLIAGMPALLDVVIERMEELRRPRVRFDVSRELDACRAIMHHRSADARVLCALIPLLLEMGYLSVLADHHWAVYEPSVRAALLALPDRHLSPYCLRRIGQAARGAEFRAIVQRLLSRPEWLPAGAYYLQHEVQPPDRLAVLEPDDVIPLLTSDAVRERDTGLYVLAHARAPVAHAASGLPR